MIIQKRYNPEVKTMGYIVDGECFTLSSTTEELNRIILKNFYDAVDWLLSQQYDEYREIQSNTINPVQQNIFIPLRQYRIKRNGHYRTVNIYQKFLGGCYLELF